MDNVDSFASRLFSTTAKLARTIGGFSESSAASLDAEMHYVRTVYPDLKARLSSVLERLSGLGNGIAETQSASWQKTQNIREEYHPKIMDTLDLMFESMVLLAQTPEPPHPSPHRTTDSTRSMSGRARFASP